MNSQQLAVLVLVCVLGPALIASYVPIYKDQVSKRHDYWLGVSSSTQSLFYIFWGLAAVGFTTYALSLLVQPLNDTRGLFSYGQWIRPVLLGVILFSSIMWSVATWMHFHKGAARWPASVTLVVTAVCTILMLAGESEANAPWYRLGGLLLFAVTVVLIDPVIWNSRWLLGE